jgi:dephospho-CoA kinase
MLTLKSKWITKDPTSRLYQLNVPIIGLTGGIATGKSTVAKILREKNFPIIDADQLVKNVYKRVEVIQFIRTNFPAAIIDDQINFKVLRQIAFSDEESIQKIENKIYQYLPEEFQLSFKQLNSPAFVIYDVPLLFEKGLNLLVDVSVCVYASEDTQISRLLSRDQITTEVAHNILKRQMNIEEKKKAAVISISNEQDINKLNENVNLFIEILFEK